MSSRKILFKVWVMFILLFVGLSLTMDMKNIVKKYLTKYKNYSYSKFYNYIPTFSTVFLILAVFAILFGFLSK